MDITGRSDRSRGHPLYDLADRHGIRVFVAPTGLAETAGVKGALAAYFYPDRRAVNRGEFPLVVATGKASELLFLQAFDRGGMSADRVDTLAFDAKTTLALHYGRPFCRADPATGRCDTAHAEREQEREAWLTAQGGDDPAAIEAFLAERPKSPYAGAARERAAWLRRMSAHPPPAPAAQWVGRRPDETFADRLPDGSAAPRSGPRTAGIPTIWRRLRTLRRERAATVRGGSCAAAHTTVRRTPSALPSARACRLAGATWTWALGCCANCATLRRSSDRCRLRGDPPGRLAEWRESQRARGRAVLVAAGRVQYRLTAAEGRWPH